MYISSILKSETIEARFLATLIANVFRFVLSFSAGILIARTLGPSEYGDFNFLLTSFASIFIFMDMGTSSAFYTFISRKKKTTTFYLYYMSWVALQFVIAILIATVLLPKGFKNRIWLGHNTNIVVLSLFASFTMNQVWQVANQVGESIRATVTVQGFNVLIAAVHLLIIFVIINLDILSSVFRNLTCHEA